MTHSHHCHHHHAVNSLNKAFILGIILNVLFVLIEFIAGFWFDSLGLISDAGHNLGDVASLILAMLAFRLAKIRPTMNYTYGYKKSTVLVSLLNAVILLIAVGFILTESIGKFFHPEPLDGGAVAWVAGLGVIVNALTAWLFLHDKEKDLNVKGAYLHMAADTLVSVGVVVSGLVISVTDWYFIDPLIGVLVAVVIVVSTWGLLRDSFRLSLDGVPTNMDIETVKGIILDVHGVKTFHHLHIWALSTTEVALTVHIVTDDLSDMERIKEELKQKFHESGISHATLEFESSACCCKDGIC